MAPRQYSTQLRDEQTQATRRRILDAGKTLFVQHGYLGTTLAQIAETAGVSVQTVYNVVGAKPILLKAVYDAALAGDDKPIPISERPLIVAMLHASDPHAALGYYAQLARELAERAGDLLSSLLAQAATGDPVLTAFAQTVESERAIGAAATASHLSRRFGLRTGLSDQDAAEQIWLLTAPELSTRLVKRRRGDWDTYQAWLTRTLTDTLLDP